MYLDYFNWGMVTLLAGIGLGYWLRGQTMTTIEADIASIKQDLINIKNYFSPSATVTVTPTPTPVAVIASPVQAA